MWGKVCVTVIERSSELGDRARTSRRDVALGAKKARTSLVNCFYLNQSLQAVYSAGPSVWDLRELGNSYGGSTIDR